MSIFGKIKDAFTSDVGTFLTQGTQGLDRKRNQALQAAERARLEQVRNRLMSDYDQAMAPQYAPAQSIDPSLEGSPDQLPQEPPPDRNQMMKDALMRAQLQGYDIGGADKTLQMMQPDFDIINGGDGSYGIVNTGTGAVQTGQLPNQMQDLLRELKEAQIRAAEAQANQRNQGAALAAAKAKVGGFAPKAPARGRASSVIPPPPKGNWVPA